LLPPSWPCPPSPQRHRPSNPASGKSRTRWAAAATWAARWPRPRPRCRSSKELAARNEPPAQQGDCKQETLQKTGNTTKFKFTCSNPPATGEGEVTVLSPEAYTMKMKTTAQVKGKAETMTMDAQGKWLSNDCGNLKPVKG
jgi:hypothetical protein